LRCNGVETVDSKKVAQVQPSALSPLHIVNETRYRQHFPGRERSLPEGPRLTISGSVERSEIERGPSLLGTAKTVLLKLNMKSGPQTFFNVDPAIKVMFGYWQFSVAK
jgi:hypothetical protein